LELHKGYTPHVEFGLIVFYKTTRSVRVSINRTTGAEQRSGTHMDRVPTSTGDYEEACKQLERRLAKPKSTGSKSDPKQAKLF
jgi:hypothetical protein